MKPRKSLDKFLEVIQYCDGKVDATALNRIRTSAESGDLAGAAEILDDSLADTNSPLPPAYWQVIAACIGEPLAEIVDSDSRYFDEKK